jgi:hypothetical protein
MGGRVRLNTSPRISCMHQSGMLEIIASHDLRLEPRLHDLHPILDVLTKCTVTVAWSRCQMTPFFL